MVEDSTKGPVRLGAAISPQHHAMLGELQDWWKRKQGAAIEHMIEECHRRESRKQKGSGEVDGAPV